MSLSPAVSIEDRVRAIAYALWLEEGQPDGRSEAHWFKAHELVNVEARQVSSIEPVKASAARKAAPRKRS